MKKLFLPVLIVVLTLPGIFSLFHQGFFLTDDGNSMVIRFSAFYEALRNGQFPVRFLPRLNYGFGYPVADFLYPLFMYLGVPIHVLGFDFVTTVKIVIGLSVIFSGLFAFFWLRTRFEYMASLAGAVIYALFPYHLWDVYKRGSVGEALALAIVPFILWQIEQKSIALAGLGIALLITSHNVLALLFLPVIILYMLFSGRFTFVNSLISVFLGFGMAVFFWLPAIVDKQYTIFDKTVVSDFTKYFLFPENYQLIGFISLAAVLFSIYGLWKKRKILYWFLWIITIISIFFSLPLSRVLWQYIPGTYFIQFPFRLLSLSILGTAFLAAVTVDCLKGKYALAAGLIFIFLVYFSSKNLFIPESFQNYPDTFYSTNVDSTTVKNEYMPVWVKTSAKTIPSEKVFLTQGSGVINNVSSNGNVIRFDAIVTNPSVMQVNTVYFPGWKAEIDGKDQKIIYDNTYGAIQIPLETGSHAVLVKFTETAIRLICDITSILFFIFAVFVFFWERKNHASE